MEVIVKLTENSLPEAKPNLNFLGLTCISTDTENILLINLRLWKKGDPASGDLSWKTCDTFFIFLVKIGEF